MNKKKCVGRPRLRNAKQVLAVRLAPEVMRYMRSVSNRAAVIDEAIRKSKGYREFRKDGKET